MPPDEHDRLLAFISHLPHVIAFSAVKSVGKVRRDKQKRNIVGGSLKDITRVAQSPPDMWADIFVQNSENICRATKIFQEEISKLIKLIKSKNRNKIKKYIKSIRRYL
jgi:prephenate dehydrogenase